MQALVRELELEIEFAEAGFMPDPETLAALARLNAAVAKLSAECGLTAVQGEVES